MKTDLLQPKSIKEILQEQIETGLHEYNRPKGSLLLSAFNAGLEIGFSVLLMGVIYTLFKGEMSKASLTMAIAFSYPIGFLFVIIGRSELFTEHTNVALHPVLNGDKSIGQLLYLWGTILLGNVIGGACIGAFLTWMGPAMKIIDVEAFTYLAKKMTKHEPLVMLGSALLAGWMMGLLSWLLSAAKETVSRIIMVIVITTVIGIGGLHHCIVGSVELFCGWLLNPGLGAGKALLTLGIAIVGNVIGGAFFVATLKYGNVVTSEE
ncbi:MAG: formate/nitrite transporter family protein [Bacteroidota bacterium]